MTKPEFSFIRKDLNQEEHSYWNWIAVLGYIGKLELEEDGSTALSEDQINDIYSFLSRHGVNVRSSGGGNPGGSFSNEPWIQIFPSTIIVSQSGGLDV